MQDRSAFGEGKVIRLGSALLSALLLALALAVLFVAVWTVIPAPHAVFLPFAVVVPEISPILLGVALLVSVLSISTPSTAVRRTVMRMSLTAAVLFAIPLVQVPRALAAFDRTLERAHIDANQGEAGARSHRIDPRDFVRGIPTGESRVARDVPCVLRGGITLPVTVYRPPTTGVFPVLVQIYGGAWQRGAPGDNETFARYFAGRGYVVFAIDYRHAPAWQWPAQADDVRDAVQWVRAHATEYDGDASRIVLIGRSSGAQLALVDAYRETRAAIAAVVAFYAPTDLVEGWRVPPRPDPLKVRSILESYLGGTPDQASARYQEASAVTYVSARVPPTLLVYASHDHIVDPRFGRELDRRLRAAGATSILLEIPWAEHAFDLVPNGLGAQVSLYYVERFLASVVK